MIMMSEQRLLANRVKLVRLQRGWSQHELAELSGVSRAGISAIETHRLVPSVSTALALAVAFGCRVEDLFGPESSRADEETWAWLPSDEPRYFWRAGVGGRVIRFPVETTVAGMLPHDGVVRRGKTISARDANPDKTLVLASCDPAAGLLALQFERLTGFRLLPLYRNSRESLELLRQGLVHIAGIHLASAKEESGNAQAAKTMLGNGFSLLRFAVWEEGLAVRPAVAKTSVKSLVNANLRWIGREPGAGARQCQDEVLGNRRRPRRLAKDHRGVADAILSGWADVGVCLRLVSEQARLGFIHLRSEAYDLCFASSLQADVRLKKLVEFLRSPTTHRLFEPLPGYELAQTMETRDI